MNESFRSEATADRGPATKPPFRIVDSYWRGWRSRALQPGEETVRASKAGQTRIYTTGRRYIDPALLPDVIDRHGPIRPVIPPHPGDIDALTKALIDAEHRALATVCSALHQLGKTLSAKLPYEQTERSKCGDPLTAGRPFSADTHALSIAARQIGPNISPSRCDVAAGALLSETLRHWTTEPGHYTEVAANLSHVLGRVVNAAGGYRHVADRWLLHNAASDPEDGELRRWVCARSAHRPAPAHFQTIPLMMSGALPEGSALGVAGFAQTLADAVTDPCMFPPHVAAWPMFAELWPIPVPPGPRFRTPGQDAPIVLLAALHVDHTAGPDVPDSEDLVAAATAAMSDALHTAGLPPTLAVLPVPPLEFEEHRRTAIGGFISGARPPALQHPAERTGARA